MSHFRIEKVQPIAGFAAEQIGPNESGRVLIRAYFNSDDPEFYRHVEQISSIYLGSRVLIDSVHAFLVVIHNDRSADVYVNQIPVEIKILAKKDIKPGLVSIEDIADVQELRFSGVEIKETDCIIFCFKKGWKFGLFFDFGPVDPTYKLDTKALPGELGTHYKQLMFQSEYAVLERELTFGQMFDDGWFPFIQLLGGEFSELGKVYEQSDNLERDLTAFLAKFGDDRIKAISGKWWKQELFGKKRKILEAGINAFLQDDAAGFIGSIKVLYPEIEGLIRMTYANETGKTDARFSDLVAFAEEKASVKFPSSRSLGFPGVFYNYLDQQIFKGFDLATGEVDLSRHSATHGVADAEDYTKARALQAILTLDQIYFYLS